MSNVESEAKYLSDKKILVNKAQCKKCKDIIESKDTNDFKRCSCGSIAVDGGLEYIKRIGNLDDIVELSQFYNNNDLSSAWNNLNNSKINMPIINYQPVMGEIIQKSLQPIIESRIELNKLITNNISSQLQTFKEYVYPSYLEFNHRLIENIKPILTAQTELISSVVKKVNPMQEIVKKLSEALKPITTQVFDNLPKMSLYFQELSETLEKIRKNPDSIYNWIKLSRSLSNYFWLPPYLMESEQLMELLETVESEEQMDDKLEKYFTDKIIESLFDEIIDKSLYKHKQILEQIKIAFYNESYALANTGLFSIIDSLCSFFVINKTKNTYRIDLFKPIIEIERNEEDNYYNVLILSMINSNVNFLYSKNKQTHKVARRHPSQHGDFFSNNKIDTIMLLHTTYYLLICTKTYTKYKRKLMLETKKIGGKVVKKYKLLENKKVKKRNKMTTKFVSTV